MAGSDFPAELSALDKALTSIEAVVDPATKKIEIAALSEEVAAPICGTTSTTRNGSPRKLSALQSEVDKLAELRSRLDDLTILIELAQDEADAPSLAEAETELTSLAQGGGVARGAHPAGR